jgi:hypothetical protein
MRKTIHNLVDLAEVKTGFPLREAAKHDAQGDALIVQMKDVDPFEGVNWGSPIRIQTKGRNEPDWLREDDILFVGRGSRFFAVHVSAPPKPSVASPHFYVLRADSRQKINPHFLVWLLNGKQSQKFYAEHIEGSALPYISRKTLAMLPVDLPDVQTQERIFRAYRCWKKERRLLEELIEQKEALIEGLLERSIHQGVAA